MIKNKTCHVIIICLTLTLSACYEPIEGCLDPLSRNYDLSADSDCDECCTYPTLGLSLTRQWNGETFSTDSTYLNAARESFRILSTDFLVHDLSVRQTSDLRSTADSLSVACDNAVQGLSDSYKAYSSSLSLTTLANFKSSGAYDQISFSLGINECIQGLEIGLLDDESVSYTTLIDYYTADSEYTTIHFSFLPTASTDTIDITINNSMPTMIALEDNLSNEKGDNLTASIVVNYAEWLKNIDFDMTTEVLKQSIINNTEGAFTVLN